MFNLFMIKAKALENRMYKQYYIGINICGEFVMLLSELKRNSISSIANDMSEKLIKFPLFMFFCTDIEKRQGFIKDYFLYHLPKWLKQDVVFATENFDTIAILSNPLEYEYKYKGVNAHYMKKYRFSSTVFMHRENMEQICDILLPYSKPSMVLTIYSSPEIGFDRIEGLIDEIVEYANQENMTLVFDTFSRRYLPGMEYKGFVTAYRKQFLNTQFVESVLIYNM